MVSLRSTTPSPIDENLVPTFCPLCVSRCGARAEVADGAFLALHPAGKDLTPRD